MWFGEAGNQGVLMVVRDLMTTAVVSVGEWLPISEALRIMITRGVGAMPVLDENGQVVGIVSERDFLRRAELRTDQRRKSWWQELFSSTGEDARDYVRAHSKRVSEMMSTDVIAVHPGAQLAEAVDLMVMHNARQLPVLRNQSLIGSISEKDVLVALAGSMPTPLRAPLTDRAIRSRISEELARHSWTRNINIRATVDRGTVALDGVVFDEDVRIAIGLLVRDIPGVNSIRDDLVLVEPISGEVIGRVPNP
jgi:CBS-domain-containing membrane protein